MLLSFSLFLPLQTTKYKFSVSYKRTKGVGIAEPEVAMSSVVLNHLN